MSIEVGSRLWHIVQVARCAESPQTPLSACKEESLRLRQPR